MTTLPKPQEEVQFLSRLLRSFNETCDPFVVFESTPVAYRSCRPDHLVSHREVSIHVRGYANFYW